MQEYGENIKYAVLLGLGIQLIHLIYNKKHRAAKACIAHIFLIIAFSDLIYEYMEAWAWAKR